VRERNEAIGELAKKTVEVNDAFKEFAFLVESQQADIGEEGVGVGGRGEGGSLSVATECNTERNRVPHRVQPSSTQSGCLRVGGFG
jgi:hypothetical protein